LQQTKFLRAQVDLPALPLHPMRDPIQLQIIHLQHRASRPITSSHHRTNPRGQIRNLERFGHEVISPAFRPLTRSSTTFAPATINTG
jgi:hypothetical protein